MSADQQLAVARTTRGESTHLSKAARQVVPPFLQKLYEIVNDSRNDELIRWSDTGDSFYVLNHERFAREVLGRWFKHQKFTSFVRQLNMYGFHKIPHLQQGVLRSESDTEPWHFEHPHFHRGQPDLLCLIQRKKQPAHGEEAQMDIHEPAHITGPPLPLTNGQVMDINSVVSGIAAIKRHQQAISTDLNELKTSNQQLWQEALAARERHKKHQDTINRILKFLAGVFGHAAGTGQHKSDVSPTSPPRVVIPRKRQRLMIEDSNDPKEHNMQEVEDDQGARGNAESSYSSAKYAQMSTPEISTARSPTLSATESFSPAVTELPPNYFPNVQAIRPTDTYSRSSTAEPSKASLSNGAAYMPATVPSDPLSPTMQSLTANQTDQGHMWSMFQHMLNSPSSMQKLMQALASQQAYPMANLPDPPHPSSPAPDIPSYPSSSSASSTSQVMMYDPNAYDVSRFHNGPVDNNLAGPMLSALNASLQHEDEHESATALEPLLDNATRLQKSYQDAHDIESDVDALQLSINTLIEGLGLDPNAIVEDHPLHDELGASQGAGGFDPSMSSSSGFAPPGGPSSSSIAPNDTSASTATSPVLEPISADPAPEFDFDNFFNELSARSAASGMQYPDVPSPFGDSGGGGHMDISGSLSNLSPGGDANPEQLAAFLDEVSSDASGPPVVPEEITATSATASGKGKKRKSDVVELLEEVARVNAEDDGDVSPQVKRKR